jgi:hypothetical protein
VVAINPTRRRPQTATVMAGHAGLFRSEEAPGAEHREAIAGESDFFEYWRTEIPVPGIPALV